MFTGIISHLGRFQGFESGKQQLCISAQDLSADLQVGDSLAVNGVCLSLIRKEKDDLYFNLSAETRIKTTLSSLGRGDLLNLELPLTLASPLGGHLVTGHIDGIGKVNRVTAQAGGKRIVVGYPASLRPFLVPKGSVALDGVSLTVAALSSRVLEVEVIPVTLSRSTLGQWRAGRRINIECDIIGKYVYNWTVKS
jgi:riboflavin synthase